MFNVNTIITNMLQARKEDRKIGMYTVDPRHTYWAVISKWGKVQQIAETEYQGHPNYVSIEEKYNEKFAKGTIRKGIYLAYVADKIEEDLRKPNIISASLVDWSVANGVQEDAEKKDSKGNHFPMVPGLVHFNMAHIAEQVPGHLRNHEILAVKLDINEEAGKDGFFYGHRQGFVAKKMHYAGSAVSGTRSGAGFAVDLNLYGSYENYFSIFGFDLKKFGMVENLGSAIKHFSRTYLSMSDGMFNILSNIDDNQNLIISDVVDGIIRKVTVKLPSGKELTIGFAPDGAVDLGLTELYLNSLEEDVDGEVTELGLVKTIRNHVNNFTDGQGLMSKEVAKMFFPDRSSSVITGRLGTVVKGLWMEYPELKERLGCDIIVGSGQCKSMETAMHELANGRFFSVLQILNSPENCTVDNISNVSLQYFGDDWSSPQAEYAVQNTYEVFESLLNLEPNAVYNNFRGSQARETEDGEINTDYDAMLALIVNRTRGYIKGHGIYEERIMSLILNMLKKYKAMEMFRCQGVLDYLYLGDPHLWVNILANPALATLDKKGETAIVSKEQAILFGAVGADEVVVPVVDMNDNVYLYTDTVEQLRLPCSSKMSIRRTEAVYNKQYEWDMMTGYFQGAQVRSALDVNVSCQDGADYDGDRGKIILNKNLQILEENSVNKIAGFQLTKKTLVTSE